MSLEVSCKVCGRKIVNLATSHRCDDGSFVGPTCKAKLDGAANDGVPSLESLILTPEEIKVVSQKIAKATWGKPSKEFVAETDQMWKDFRNIPWDVSSGSILTSPAHPQAIASVNLNELVKFNPPKRKGEDDPKLGYEEITDDHIARAVHCFLKYFRDPGLNSEQMELFNKKLGLKLLGVAPSARRDETHSDFVNFVITSTKSPFPERAIMISISEAKWTNFRCLNLLSKGVESSYLSAVPQLVPFAGRRAGADSNFKLISAFVTSVFMMDDPEQSEALNKVFPFWHQFNSISGDRAFNFIVPEGSDEDEE